MLINDDAKDRVIATIDLEVEKAISAPDHKRIKALNIRKEKDADNRQVWLIQTMEGNFMSGLKGEASQITISVDGAYVVYPLALPKKSEFESVREYAAAFCIKRDGLNNSCYPALLGEAKE